MGAAFGWGLLSASSLVIGSLVAVWLKISLRVIGLIVIGCGVFFGGDLLISRLGGGDRKDATTGRGRHHPRLRGGVRDPLTRVTCRVDAADS